MVEKMMKIAGRSESGFAKPLKTDEKGVLRTASQSQQIVAHLAATRLMTSINGYAGDIVGVNGATTPIDISSYPNKVILIKNNHNFPIEFTFWFFANKPVLGITSNNYTAVTSQVFKISAGETKLITHKELEALSAPYLGLATFYNRGTGWDAATATGSFDFIILGNPETPLGNREAVASEPFSGTSSQTKNFNNIMTGFAITNDGTNPLTFTINGETYTVLAGESFQSVYSPFKTVSISATGAFRAYGRR